MMFLTRNEIAVIINWKIFKCENVTLELIYDSGAQFEKITNVALPTGFNSSFDNFFIP